MQEHFYLSETKQPGAHLATAPLDPLFISVHACTAARATARREPSRSSMLHNECKSRLRVSKLSSTTRGLQSEPLRGTQCTAK